MQNILEIVRYAASGGILASALANIAASPSDKANVAIALVGSLLTVILVKARHIVD